MAITIGRMAKATATNIETIRYYERIGLLRAPSRTDGNYRSYGEEELVRLSFIRRSRDLGFSIDQIRELLQLSDDRERDCAGVDEIARTHLVAVERKLEDLGRLHIELKALIASCKGGSISECRIIDALGPAASVE